MNYLRAWQEDCVSKAINHYRKQRHFFCQATPGAGKTVTAAELASRMLNAGQIDFVLCFSPSIAVSEGMRKTFARRLNARFDAKMGAIGGSFTYQSMGHLSDDFWALLDDHRVLVVFDEVHHCAGQEAATCNVWGQLILSRIQHRAAFTFAMSGTPWRSDQLPIVLARYADESQQICPHFTYRLATAVIEGVCRAPNIALIDNDVLQLGASNTANRHFNSIETLLEQTGMRYDAVLRNQAALKHIIELACEQLQNVRQSIPDAAGLAVASSVDHAEQIAEILRARGESTVVVNYQVSDPHGAIRLFNDSDSRWIVSVGMISEGTDIPRLQVCCHLSRIRTELYFRQVLGRILRTRKIGDDHAWLYVFAEPTLSRFAQRVAEDAPELAIMNHFSLNPADDQTYSPQEIICDASRNAEDPLEFGIKNAKRSPIGITISGEPKEQTLTFVGQYRREVLRIFDSPF